MAALAATNSATPSQRTSLIRNQLEAARRQAEQAQANEERLRQQVAQAESQTQNSNEKVRSLNRQLKQASQTDPTYTSRLQSGQAAAAIKTQEWVNGLYSAVIAKRGMTLNTSPSSTPVLNTQGQTTGRILNLSA